MSMLAHEKRYSSQITAFLGVGRVLQVNVLTTKPNLMIPKTRDLSSIHVISAFSKKRKEEKKQLTACPA